MCGPLETVFMCEQLFCWRFESRVSPVLDSQVQSEPPHNLAKFQETFDEETPDNSDGSLELPHCQSFKSSQSQTPFISNQNKYRSDSLPMPFSVSNDQQNDLPGIDINQEQEPGESWAPVDHPEPNYNDDALGADDQEYDQPDSWKFAEEDVDHEEETYFVAHPVEGDPNHYDIWMNNDDQEIEPNYDHQQYEYSNFEHDLGTEDYNSAYDETAATTAFDETFFSTPSLQVLHFDQPSPCEEEEGMALMSHRPPRPKKNIVMEVHDEYHEESQSQQWAWSSSPVSSDPQPNQRSLRSAYSYSTNHLALDQTSRPQTADPSRPLHLTDTVEDGDEPYEISFSTPSILPPRVSSPHIPTSRVGSSQQLKRPHSLPNGLIASSIH
jgi:hypothetical protein